MTKTITPTGYFFDSHFSEGPTILPEYTQDEIKNEPMLYSCDPWRALNLGGPITKAFLHTFSRENPELASEWYEDDINGKPNPFCIDTRVHMLMPGMWPCIPGWHHDDIRRDLPNGQPNYDDQNGRRPEHCLALVGGHVAPTEFLAADRLYMPRPAEDEKTYKLWDFLINEHLVRPDAEFPLTVHRIPDRKLIYFDGDAFHQGTQAVATGWRWFGRITWNADYENGRPRANELRRQVNVYLTAPKDGW